LFTILGVALIARMMTVVAGVAVVGALAAQPAAVAARGSSAVGAVVGTAAVVVVGLEPGLRSGSVVVVRPVGAVVGTAAVVVVGLGFRVFARGVARVEAPEVAAVAGVVRMVAAGVGATGSRGLRFPVVVVLGRSTLVVGMAAGVVVELEPGLRLGVAVGVVVGHPVAVVDTATAGVAQLAVPVVGPVVGVVAVGSHHIAIGVVGNRHIVAVLEELVLGSGKLEPGSR